MYINELTYGDVYLYFSVWEKVKAAARQLGTKTKEDVVSVIKEYKPKIVEALKTVGKVIIQAGKDWVIEVKDGIVKIIGGGEEGTSSGETFEGGSQIYIVYNSPNSKAGEKIKESKSLLIYLDLLL